MPLAIGVALAVICLIVAAIPFLKRRGVPTQYTDPILELQGRREAVYQEVRTLHNDYALGDVPQADYEERLESYRLMAARLLQQQTYVQEMDQRLEDEVKRLRNGAKPSIDQLPCPECGRPVARAAEQCPSCGTLLSGIAPDE